MREVNDNLSLFIQEQKSYFDTVLSPDAGIVWGESWQFRKAQLGFLIGANASINFNEISLKAYKYLFSDNEEIDSKVITIEPIYADFIQALLVYKIRTGKKNSSSKLVAFSIMLKRLYARLIVSGIEPLPCSISSENLQEVSDLLAQFRSKTCLANDQIYLRNIAETLREKRLTYGIPEFNTTAKIRQTKQTKRANEADYAEELGDEEDRSLVTIQDFLNVIALRNLVERDAEKIMLNMTMLLFVTGFRFEELAGLRFDSLKRLEIEDESVRELLKSKGLKTYYLGILYQGKKGAGMRTHWVEPLAIDLVEFIFNDTLQRTQALRELIKTHRKNKFKTLLPIDLANDESIQELELRDIVEHIYESTSDSIRHTGDLKRNALKKLEVLGLTPHRIFEPNSRFKHQFFTRNQIDVFLKKLLKSSPDLTEDMTYRVRDSKNGYSYDVNYEDLLFIATLGSTTITRTGLVKPLATPIFYKHFKDYLGMGKNRNGSIFAKYNLKNSTGEYTQLRTHMPRHNKNTFLAIADVSEHLQAMVMGRVDITQNKSYQHLAIEEKSLSTSLVTYRQINQQNIPSSPTDAVKTTGEIGLNYSLKPDNALVQNTHTFTTDSDRVSFISDVADQIDLDIFEEFAGDLAGFTSDKDKQETIRTHSDLFILPMGSCTRKVSIIECPFNMKCQDGTACPYLSLTGRADDAAKLSKLKSTIESEINNVIQYQAANILTPSEAQEILVAIGLRQENVRMLTEQSLSLESKKQPVDLVEWNNMKKPIRIASIFAIEHRAIQQNKVEKV